MPRKPRMYLAGVPCHVVQRGNNRDACFFTEDDSRFYLDALRSWELVHEIRTALDFSMPLGNDRFRQQIEGALGRAIGQAKRGWPIAGLAPERE